MQIKRAHKDHKTALKTAKYAETIRAKTDIITISSLYVAVMLFSKLQTFLDTIKLQSTSAGSNCLLWCQGRRRFWHRHYCSSPRGTSPRATVYPSDNLHYSSNTTLSRPPTVPRRSDQIWEAPDVSHLANKRYHFLLRDGWAAAKCWLDKSWHVWPHKLTKTRRSNVSPYFCGSIPVWLNTMCDIKQIILITEAVGC